MTLRGQSFLQILQDDESPVSLDSSVQISQDSSVQWDDDDDSFEVSEVTNSASSDTNLADALRSIVNAHGSLEVQTPEQPSALERTYLNGKVSLKEELKAKIQTRRKSEGVGELRVKFEAPKSYPLTPEERDKVLKRKHRNRLSANKSRLKRQQHEDNLQKELENLETENDKLSNEVKLLQNIKRLLSTKMASHKCSKQDTTSSSIASHWCTIPDVTSSSITNHLCTKSDMGSSIKTSHECTKEDMTSSFNHLFTKRNVTSSSLAALNSKCIGGRTSTQTAAALHQDVLSH
ncbi:transcription factor kayak-like [Mercenaria mercenaria]|uniref:transcription factor kayak-like n=1 Tax=Mercenaria mercenaria TaxID=6596 RepID=UPI001E1D8A99|nr:transcription factor kayak-like [Mercenaria mercenaria]